MGELINMDTQGCPGRIRGHPQTHLSAFAPNCPDDGWTAIAIIASSPAVVRTSTWWVIQVGVSCSFFPRILEHFIGFRKVVNQRWIRLMATGIVLKVMPQR